MQLVVQTGPDAGKVFNLDRPVLVVGRQMGNDVLLNDTQVSRRHVQFELRDGQVFVIDLGSANGTTVNGQKLPPNEPKPLRAGDLVRLGITSLALQDAIVNPGPEVAVPVPAYGPPPATYNSPPMPPPPLYQNPAQAQQPPYYNNPPVPGYPAPGPAFPVNYGPSYAPPPVPVKPKGRNNGLLIVLGVLIIGGLLIGLIALLGNEAGKSPNTGIGTGINSAQPTAGSGNNGNSPEPTVTLAPAPTVVRGQSGTNPPPPSPPSVFSSGEIRHDNNNSRDNTSGSS